MILLALVLAAAAPTADDARFITSIVASAVADHPRVDVITQEDVRKAVAVEAERQSLGCSEQSCLAEVASAMGARIVVFGSVGTFADDYAVEVSAFDAETASSLGRAVLNGPSLKDVAAEAKERAAGFRDKGIAGLGSEGRLRVLVLDFELRNVAAQTTTTTTTEASFTGLQWAGIGAGAVAGVALVVGVGADAAGFQQDLLADSRDTKAADAGAAYAARDNLRWAAIGGYATAVVVGAVAGVLFVGGAPDEPAPPP
jgi:hypothetical protein